VVSQGRVYVTDAQISGRKAAQERVRCLAAATGASLWTHSYAVDYADWAFDPNNPFGPRPTPILSQDKLYTLGARGRLCCFEARHGKLIWSKDLANKSKDSAFTPSPLIEGNLLILILDGLPPGPCVFAFDKRSGKQVWSALEQTANFSSPIVVEAAGKRQLIVWTQGEVNSLNPATGQLYWRERSLGGSSFAVSTPASRGELLLVNGMMLRLDSTKPGASVLWPDGSPPSRHTISDTSTPMFKGDYVFTGNLAGELVCIEAKSGRIVWQTNQVTDLKSGTSMHLTPNGSSTFIFNDRGELIRAELSAAGYKETSRAALLAPTYPFGPRKRAWTPPAFAGRHVFARSDEELVCGSLEGRR
jgi:outer membrane protein assembly factor BamB